MIEPPVDLSSFVGVALKGTAQGLPVSPGYGAEERDAGEVLAAA